MSDKILSAYREFISLHEAFLKNVDSTFKHGFQTNERIQKLCQDYRERKGYNITHRAKIELLDLEIQEGIKFSLVLNNVRKDISKLHNWIDEIITSNNLTDVNVRPDYEPFFENVRWFWEFEKWFNDSLDSEKQKNKADQLTARQISIVFYFLKKAGHFRNSGETTKDKKFLSNISGYSVDAFKKFFPDPFRQSKEFKPKENASLITDLKKVAVFLDETGYPDAARLCRTESQKTQKSRDID